MATFSLICLVLALVLSLLAALNLVNSRFALFPAAFFFYVLAGLLAGGVFT